MSLDSEKATDAMDFASTIADALKRFRRLTERNLVSLGLTLQELRVLGILAENGPSPMVMLAGELYLTPGSVTSVVDRLERQGLVERVRSEKDRRIINVMIAEKGTQLFERARKHHLRFLEKALRPLSPKETKELESLLLKIIAAAESS